MEVSIGQTACSTGTGEGTRDGDNDRGTGKGMGTTSRPDTDTLTDIYQQRNSFIPSGTTPVNINKRQARGRPHRQIGAAPTRTERGNRRISQNTVSNCQHGDGKQIYGDTRHLD